MTLALIALIAGFYSANAQVTGVEVEVHRIPKYQEFVPGVEGLYEGFGLKKVCDRLGDDCDLTSFHFLVFDGHKETYGLNLEEFYKGLINKKTTETAIFFGQILDEIAVDRVIPYIRDELVGNKKNIIDDKITSEEAMMDSETATWAERKRAKKKIKKLEKELRKVKAEVNRFIKKKVMKWLRLRQNQECFYVYGMEIIDRADPSYNPVEQPIPNSSDEFRKKYGNASGKTVLPDEEISILTTALWKLIKQKVVIRPGQSKPGVATIKTFLNLYDSSLNLNQSKVYGGPNMKPAVEKFQEEKGLKVDGDIGSNTLEAMITHANVWKE